MDRAKTDVIEQLPPPTNVKGVRSFVCHAGFYRTLIKDFDEECLIAFYTLKKALISAPII